MWATSPLVLFALSAFVDALATNVQNPGGYGFSYVSCYSDSTGDRTLAVAGNNPDQTVDGCAAFCSNNGYSYMGLEYYGQCFCDNEIGGSGTVIDESNCDDPCTGNTTELCGGSNALSIYFAATTAVNEGTANPGAYKYVGCYTDHQNNTNAVGEPYPGSNMTIEVCANICYTQQNTAYMGLEYHNQCFCGNSISPPNHHVAEYLCNQTCVGNTSEICGGPNLISIYSNDPNAPVLVNSVSSSSVATSTASTATISSSSAVTSSTTSIAVTSTVTSTQYSTVLPSTTSVANPTTASITTSATTQTTTSSSSSASTIASTTLQTATSSASALPTSEAVVQPGSFQYVGCYWDQNGATGAGNRTLSTQYPVSGENSLEACATVCLGYGFYFFGVEYGVQCYCGNQINPPNTLIDGTQSCPRSSECECSYACPGDSSELCGGSATMNVYERAGGAGDNSNSLSSSQSSSVSSSPSASVASSSILSSSSSVVSSTGALATSSPAANVDSSSASSASSSLASVLSSAASVSSSAAADTASGPGPSSSVASVLSSAAFVSSSAAAAASSGSATGAGSGAGSSSGNSGSSGSGTTPSGGSSATTSTAPPPGITTVSSDANTGDVGYRFYNCYDSSSGSSLSHNVNIDDLTLQICASACAGSNYTFFGAQGGNQCACGNTVVNAAKVSDSCSNEESVPCAGNIMEQCGGPNAMVIYGQNRVIGNGLGASTTSAAGGAGGGSGTATGSGTGSTSTGVGSAGNGSGSNSGVGTGNGSGAGGAGSSSGLGSPSGTGSVCAIRTKIVDLNSGAETLLPF